MDKREIQFKNCNKAKYLNVIKRNFKKLNNRIDNFNKTYNEDYVLYVTKQTEMSKEKE